MGSSNDKPPRHVAIALVFDPDTKRILMVSSRAHSGMWILPKGGIEKGETSGQAAVRESYEEAGTPPDLPIPSDEDRLMMITLEAGAGQKRAAVWHVHVLEVSEAAVTAHDKWPEAHERERKWVTLQECLHLIQAWSIDPSTSDDIASQGGVVVEEAKLGKAGKKSKEGSRAKKEQKSGAMETALRHFALARGFEGELQ